MKEVFDLRRFGNYFTYDLNRAVTRYGLTALILGAMPILLLFFNWFFSFLFDGDGSASTGIIQSWPFIIMIILCMSFGPRVYGAVTDRKVGTEWISLPASALEKTLSMLLLTCVVLPAAMIALLTASNAVVSLFVPDFGSILPFGSIDGLFGEVMSDEGYFNFPLIFWLNWCESILVFTLGAICFKRNKVGKTLLCLIGIGMLLSILMVAIFHTTQLSGDDLERLFGDFDAARAQTWLNVALNCIYGVVFALLIGGLYARIKTIKA